MLAYQTAHVFAVGAGFAAKAWRVGDILDRQLLPFEHFVAVQIGQRHFGGGNKKVIARREMK